MNDEQMQERELKLRSGIEQFNRQEFFDCHETLEELWMHDSSPERELIQGIIQIAVGYYHHLRDNQVGALKLLTRGLARVKKYEPTCLQLNIQRFALAVEENIHEIESQPQETVKTLNIPIIENERD